MNFIYFANVRMPTEKAHGLQIMKTCEALAKQNLGGFVTLIVPNRKNVFAGDVFGFYGISKPENFNIVSIRVADFLRFGILKPLAFALDQRIFATRAFRRYAQEDAIFYTREFSVAKRFGSARKKIFYEIHTLSDALTKKRLDTFRRCAGLVVISQGLRDDLMSAGIPDTVIRVVPDAVDFNRFQVGKSKEECRDAVGIPRDKKIVVYTGHLYPWKGAYVVAEAAGLAPDAEFYLVGGTAEDVERFSATYHAKNLHMQGWQRPSVIPLWLKAADFIVIPTSAKESIGKKYTSPLKLFEAMAIRKKPILAADVPSTREILSEREAYFFKPDDARALAEAVRYGQDHYEELEERAERARELVQKYTWERRAERILRFVQSR